MIAFHHSTASQVGFLFHLPNIHFQYGRRTMYNKALEIYSLEARGFLFVRFVLVPPSIADEPTDLLVTKHAPTVITCTASGVPFPTIQWTKNGVRLLPRGEGYRILSSGKTKLSGHTALDCVLCTQL